TSVRSHCGTPTIFTLTTDNAYPHHIHVAPRMIFPPAVPPLHPERMPLGLELDAGLEELVPGLGEMLEPGFVEPVLPVDHALADVRLGHGLPFAVVDGQGLDLVVPAALLLAHRLGDVGHVHQGVAVEPLLLNPGQVGARLVLDHRDQLGHRAATGGLDLVVDLDAGGLLVGRDHHLDEVLVEVFHVGALAREDDRRRLGLDLARDPGSPGDACGAGSPGGELQKITTAGLGFCGLCHPLSPYVPRRCHATPARITPAWSLCAARAFYCGTERAAG